MNAHPELLAAEAAHQHRIAQRIARLLGEMFPDTDGDTLNQFAKQKRQLNLRRRNPDWVSTKGPKP
ncbi:hypothetical protein QMT40_002179 [Parvibaculaceae bacterium PLY_AMNH_Bact1]|nr:hypothetical protein QMT40_002179 [Parvibaculaceae bacterium PLY_AMNH_Bact1]